MSTVLISGANRGLGALTALEFARAGHEVFAGARDVASLDDVVAAAERENLTLHPVALDVTVPATVAAAVEQVGDVGALDIVVSNAGVAAAGPVELADDSTVAALFEVNTFGALRLIRAALPVMREQRSGTIVAVGSLSGRIPSPGMGMYAASKQALVAALEAVAFEVAQFGVRVSCIEPGPYRTQLENTTGRVTQDHGPYEQLMARLVERTGRRFEEAGDPAEVARAVVTEATSARPRLHVAVGAHARAALGDRSERFAEQWLERLGVEIGI